MSSSQNYGSNSNNINIDTTKGSTSSNFSENMDSSKPLPGPSLTTPSFFPSAPTFTPSAPTFTPSAPTFTPSAPSSFPSAPTFTPSAPTSFPSAPTFTPSAPTFTPSAATFTTPTTTSLAGPSTVPPSISSVSPSVSTPAVMSPSQMDTTEPPTYTGTEPDTTVQPFEFTFMADAASSGVGGGYGGGGGTGYGGNDYGSSAAHIGMGQNVDYDNLLVDTQGMDIDPNTEFTAIFHDAYTFKMLIEYLNTTLKNIYMYFTPTSIRITRAPDNPDSIKDDDYNVFNEAIIDTAEIFDYEYQSKYKQFLVMIEIKRLREMIKTRVKKKSTMRLYKTADDYHIYFQVAENVTFGDQDNVVLLQPLKLRQVKFYELPQYSLDEREPNVKVTVGQFGAACSAGGQGTHDSISIIGYPYGVDFRIGKADNSTDGTISTSTGGINRYGNIYEEDEKIETIVITKATIKSLGKLTGLTSNALIKLYFEKDKQMKIMTRIGSYGIIRLYVSKSN